jgi:hypothetical protein
MRLARMCLGGVIAMQPLTAVLLVPIGVRIFRLIVYLCSTLHLAQLYLFALPCNVIIVCLYCDKGGHSRRLRHLGFRQSASESVQCSTVASRRA